MNPDALIITAVCSIIFVLAIAQHARARNKARRFNFDWYRKTHPQLVHNGRVTCCKCSGNDVGVERMLNRTYVRSHICRSCGTTLYYSSEK